MLHNVTMSVSEVPPWVAARLGARAPGRGVQEVLRTLGSHPRQMSYASVQEAAGLAEVNPATVVRAAQLIGFTGWPQLRAEVRSRYLSLLSASEVLQEHGEAQGAGESAVRQDLHNLRDLGTLLDEDQLARVAAIIMAARTTLVLGSGSFAAPGLQLAHLTQTLGHDVRLERAGGTALLNAFAMLREGDALVIFHLWRTPGDLLQIAGLARDRGVRLVVVGDHARPGITALADEFVMVPSEGASMFPSLVPTVTVVQAVVAAIVAADPGAATRATDAADELWRDFGLFPRDKDGLLPEVQ